ncbi:glycine betaine ABC transporter substrate-binding protein [Sporolactobacillus nakayamae]|uniref:Glycine betaine/proline transport system substrate-binding protein n=1 Tax=Sporolactobacillus nakayamae TaxID=269670 RepID=A0A1I2QIU3_9BACL|nr:glycine betaine ABC transporter substrate-binding protein [Sporolactobacillus nakayamae]SFG28314.1 glycine betaine/proline transport system substrate-binding protein [Sporolactobacillus nakayamae]
MKKVKVTVISVFLLVALVLAGCQNQSSGSADSFGNQVDHKIIGIDPGAGEMKLTDQVVKDYELSNWTVQSGSEATMTASLEKAIKKKQPIVVTGWTPHWMFQKYDLKYLKDPKGIYGKSEEIHTIIHKGFDKKDPNAVKVLDQFSWAPDDMSKVMLDIQKGTDADKAARKWVKENQKKVDEWTKGAKKVSGKKIKLGYVAWASEIASTNVVTAVLEDLGYTVTMEQLGAGQMWAGVAKGSDDAIVAAWLPTTHADYMKQFKSQVTDLGPNLKGTKLGLVVPSYVSIDSINDLKD